MNLWSFVQKHIKTLVDYDKAYGGQCVDLYRQYCQDVLGVPRTESVVGAKDLVECYEKNAVEKGAFMLVEDRLSGQQGDVVVWGATKTNPYGHVAIVLEYHAGGELVVFEQDGYKQDGAKIAWRTAKGVIGYLRKWRCL